MVGSSSLFISRLLPPTFAIVFDWWTSRDTHYVAVYATFPSDTPNGFACVLLAFSPFENETSQGSSNYPLLFEFVLRVYDKDLSNVCAIIGDNCNTNRVATQACNFLSFSLCIMSN